MLFSDRGHAGRNLTERLPTFDRASTVVLTPPRGGLPVAREIALAFGLPLDVVLVRRLAVPGHADVALGALSEGRDVRLSFPRDSLERLGLDADQRTALAHMALSDLSLRHWVYAAAHPDAAVAGKTVILVDDGAATGATLRAAAHVLRERGAGRLVLALPVAPAHLMSDLERLCDEVVCLHTPSPFMAVGAHYAAFEQISDREVRLMLEEMRGRAAIGPDLVASAGGAVW